MHFTINYDATFHISYSIMKMTRLIDCVLGGNIDLGGYKFTGNIWILDFLVKLKLIYGVTVNVHN